MEEVGSLRVNKVPLTSVDFSRSFGENKYDFGRLAQWLERLLHTQEATGSNPVLPTPKWRNGRRATFRT